MVITTITGREHLLARAIKSVRNQSWQPYDLIIHLDERRAGAAAARNRALAQVVTPWVAWLDDDDEMLSNHLQVCMRWAARTGADLVYPGMIAVGGRDPLATPINGILVNPFQVPFGPEQAHHLKTVGNFIPITWLGKVDLIRGVGGFPTPTPDPSKGSGRIEEDYGLLLKLLDRGAKIVHAPVRTWKYHFHQDNTGGRGEHDV